MISLGELSNDKPAELLVTAAVRAKLCNGLASEVGMADRRADLFLMGAFSLIDTMLEQPMAEVLAQLPLDGDLKTALRGRSNSLRPVLEFVQAYDHCDWEDCGRLAQKLGLDDRKVTTIYRDAVSWAMQSFAGSPRV